MLFNLYMTLFANVNKLKKKNTPRNSYYVFGQQGNLLHFEDMLHNLCFIFQTMLFSSRFHLFFFCSNNTFFSK